MRILFPLALFSLGACAVAAAEKVDYTRDVLPILEAHCIGCHTRDEAQGGLVMESHADLMSGGTSGLAITAGAPSSSRLYLMVTGQMEPVMPPEGEERPSEEELELLTTWIEQGAVGPAGDLPIKRPLRTPKLEPKPDVQLPVTAIAVSADGSLRAVARFGKVTITRDDETEVSVLSKDLGKINSLRFNKAGTRVLVASGVTGAYGSAAVFNVQMGEQELELVGHRDVLYAAVFSPDESKIATAGYDRDIILWDAQTAEPIRNFSGHNGAVYDLAFSPDGAVLVSGCADETVKVWNVDSGQRLDTLSQPEGEVFAVDVTSDGKFILAGSGDNRLRVWSLRSLQKPRINPIVVTRFVDESPLVQFALTPDGKTLVVLSEAGNVKLIRTSDWSQAAVLEPLGETGSDLSITPDGKTLIVSLMNGQLVRRPLPPISNEVARGDQAVEPIYMDLEQPVMLNETTLSNSIAEPSASAAPHSAVSSAMDVPRGAKIIGTISAAGQADLYRWQARRGEVWAIDADAHDGSPIDPIVTVLDEDGSPVLRTRLQAVRDSYFTFRGKNSSEISDFRLFNWEEMNLNDYLYAAGEVTRLWMHPRGPDSGFNVYPNEGNRWTFFGTTHTTHALGEPAYVVRPLSPGEEPIANGLPVFDIHYENDDDPMQLAGNNSRLLFTAPSDGEFIVRITDTRGAGADTMRYQLSIRAATPGFTPSVALSNATLRQGAGREFIVRVDRQDGFDGPVTFDIPNLPETIHANVPLTIEPGQRYAVGTLWVGETVPVWEAALSLDVVARAEVHGRSVERRAGTLADLKLAGPPQVIPSVQPIDRTVPADEDWTLSVRRGETVTARAVLRRQEGANQEVGLGKENAGRNAPHGVYVDNIGLNGLLVLEGANEREFFLTADPIAVPGKRSFFLTAEIDGNVTSHPITVEVLP